MCVRAEVLCCTAVVALGLHACRPPLVLAPCGPAQPCPAGYTCHPARSYCVAPPSAGDDAAATDVPAADRAPADLQAQDSPGQDLSVADQAGPDLLAEDAPLADSASTELGEIDSSASDLSAALDQAATDGDRAVVDAGLADAGETEAGLVDAVLTADGPTGLQDRQQTEAGVELDVTLWLDGTIAALDGAQLDQQAVPDGSIAADSITATPDATVLPDAAVLESGVVLDAHVGVELVYIDAIVIREDATSEICAALCPTNQECYLNGQGACCYLDYTWVEWCLD